MRLMILYFILYMFLGSAPKSFMRDSPSFKFNY
nr:MAG TPA: hypothetical protein [Caudoviricetes sp.]